MPPRKKAADGTPAAPSRSSARTRAAQAAAAATTPAPPPLPPQAKPKSKRPRASSVDEPASKPTSKKAKKRKAKEDGGNEAEAETEDAQKDADDDVAQEEPKKMVTVIKRGAAPVDPHSGRVDTHMVYTDGSTVWDAMLNQTDVSGSENKNKFYVLQLLHSNQNTAQCFLYTRWGRVGENGQNQTKGPWAPQVAIGEFKKQFKSKTAVSWEDRVGMIAKKGKYTWIERDYSDEDDSKDDKKADNKEPVVIPDSKLEPEIQNLCKLIFSTSLIDAHLSSMNYDAKKLPLGKLAKSTILSGFAALKANEELNLVDALGDMEIASKLISTNLHADANGAPINSLDANFRSLGLTSMKPVISDTQEFKTLEAYVRDTHGATHRHFQVSVENAYRVERASETEAWNERKFSNLNGGERLLLWHGSRTTNFAGILKQGLRIAPPEAPVTGYMFGKGVYFADMMSKSAGYCYAHLSNNTGLLLLCEVAVKPFHELTHSSYYADQECKSNNKMATKGIGRTQPVDWKDAGVALENEELIGCQMPAGPGKDVLSPNAYLQYNEYIVYDISQIRLRYLLMVKM
ncbi:Poly [ADP-ribose] polymerase 2-A [Termitomyces sp. J132]|nr:Poly [ADP-ribose] polymerase 2-A [Termitomyces sp. J132]